MFISGVGKSFICFTVAGCLLSASSAAFCQESPLDKPKHTGPSAFFENGTVNDIFKSKLSVTDRDNIVLELPKRLTREERNKQNQEALEEAGREIFTIKEKKNLLGQSSPFVQRENKNNPYAVNGQLPQTGEDARQKLIAQYGNPDQRISIKADEKAPAAFKAMTAALDAGDEELAYKYAKQYEQYKADLARVAQETTKLSSFISDYNKGATLNELQEKYPDMVEALKYEYEKQRAEEEADSKYVKTLDERAMQMIQEKKAERYEMFSKYRGSQSIVTKDQEESERLAARKFLSTRKIPKTSDGRVDILMFINPRDSNVRAMSGDLEKLYQLTLKERGQLNFMAMTISEFDTHSVNNFKATTKVTFPIIAGAQLAKGMNITIAPTVAFICPSNGAQYVEKGLRSFYFYDELLKLMRGK